MFKVVGSGPYCAISYDSATFADLSYYMGEVGLTLQRCQPDDFLASVPNKKLQYINLVTVFPLRRQISEYLDHQSLNRFSFFAGYIPETHHKPSGVFTYPGVSIYPSAQIGNDVLIHGNSGIAHQTKIGQGCFVSGHVVVCGSTRVGDYCWLGVGTTIVDNITIADGTTTVTRSLVINDIHEPNTVYKKHANF